MKKLSLKKLLEGPFGGQIPSPGAETSQMRARAGQYGSPEQAQLVQQRQKAGRTVNKGEVQYKNPKLHKAFKDSEQELNNLMDVATQVRTFLARQDVQGAMNYLPQLSKLSANVAFNLQQISAAQAGGAPAGITGESFLREDHIWDEPESQGAKIEEEVLRMLQTIPKWTEETQSFIAKGRYQLAFHHLQDIEKMIKEAMMKLKAHQQSSRRMESLLRENQRSSNVRIIDRNSERVVWEGSEDDDIPNGLENHIGTGRLYMVWLDNEGREILDSRQEL